MPIEKGPTVHEATFCFTRLIPGKLYTDKDGDLVMLTGNVYNDRKLLVFTQTQGTEAREAPIVVNDGPRYAPFKATSETLVLS